jgi:type IV pilus assembly protein PilE
MPKLRIGPGFTLVELLVAVAVLGILFAVAAPLIVDQISKARRVDAMNALGRIQLEQAKFRASCPHYADTMVEESDEAQCSSILWPYWDSDEETSPEGYYRIALVSSSTTTFVATATARDAQKDDDECPTFAVSQNGPIVNADDPFYDASYADADCWRR